MTRRGERNPTRTDGCALSRARYGVRATFQAFTRRLVNSSKRLRSAPRRAQTFDVQLGQKRPKRSAVNKVRGLVHVLRSDWQLLLPLSLPFLRARAFRACHGRAEPPAPAASVTQLFSSPVSLVGPDLSLCADGLSAKQLFHLLGESAALERACLVESPGSNVMGNRRARPA